MRYSWLSFRTPALSRRLQKLGPTSFSVYCIVAAFGTYFCMYAFRKPFTAGTFEGAVGGGLALKTLFIAAQVAGYTLSKFIGIRVVSEMPAHRRAISILGLIAFAELALFLFAITPSPWSALFLFMNGLPLGMVFGLVLAFLEGRKQTEALTAGLCASFILSSGVVKSVGRGLIHEDIASESWMPFATGLIFAVPLVLFVFLLAQIPPPKAEDVAERSERTQMFGPERRAFFKRYAAGIIGLVGCYLLLTIGRSTRDDFAVEIWRDLGTEGKPSIFARTETFVMLGVVFINGTATFIRSNRRAFLSSLVLCASGFVLLGACTFLHRMGAISPFTFMVLTGLGMYVPYVAFHTTVFERLIAVFRERGTLGYLMYLADAFGYLGYVAVLVIRNLTTETKNFLDLYLVLNLIVAISCLALVVFVWRVFSRRMRSAEMAPHTSTEVATQ